MALQIIMIILFVWIFVIGYLSPRKVTRKRNRWHAWGLLGQVWFWIDGDKKSFPVPAPWPFGKVEVPLFYTRYAEKKDLGSEGRTITKVPGRETYIEEVYEKTFRLRKREIRPYQIQMNFAISGLIFFADINVTLDIVEPDKFIKIDNVLFKYGTELKDVVGSWGALTERNWIDDFKKNTSIPEEIRRSEEEQKLYIIQKMFEFRIDANPITVAGTPLKEYMNKTKNFVGEYGLETIEFAFEAGYDEQVRKLITLKTDLLNKEKENKIRDKERERELADENQLILLAKNRLDNVQIPLLNKIKEVESAKNSGFQGSTLFTGNASESVKLDAILASTFPEKKSTKKGGEE
jgi:hypothetical protein